MTTLNKKMISTAIILGTFATACAANTVIETGGANTENTKTDVSQDYVKPGASVSYSHNLANQVKSYEPTTFQLRLQETYSKGSLSVSVEAEDGLQFHAGSTGNRFDMASGNEHVMDISFTATSQGRHYINVQAMADTGDGQAMPRAFSIPVQVGAPTPMKPNENMQTTASGENIIVMEAEEEIK